MSKNLKDKIQAFSLGLGEKFDEVKKMYAEANLALGDIIKSVILVIPKVLGIYKKNDLWRLGSEPALVNFV